jgi:protein-tyrosine phosphatase
MKIFRLLFSVVIASACPVVCLAGITKATCEQTGPNQYKLSFHLTDEAKYVDIYASSDPENHSNGKPLVRTSKEEVTVSAGKPSERMYFFIRPNKGKQLVAATRELPLEGTPNFRDLGGYPTEDGRSVKWGVLYRSGSLENLTPQDLTYLNHLNIRLVCDFRTSAERQVSPEKWIPDADTQLLSLPIGEKTAKQKENAPQALVGGSPSPEDIRMRMRETYAHLVIDFADIYAKTFTQIEQGHVPAVYHCTAGKDRTGIFSAFVLLTLGVSREDVIQDFAVTNRYLLNDKQNRGLKAIQQQPAYANLSPLQLQALEVADPVALDAALNAIDRNFGSFENYRRQALHVSDADVARLQKQLLE